MSEESMKLPQGMCCGSCALFKKCEKIFGCNPTSQECDFYPVRFSVSPSRFLQECSESDRLRARVAKLEGELKEARAIILDLVKTIDASVYGEDNLHHHTCPAPDHGGCTCGAYEAMNAARQEEYKGAK